MTEPNTTEPHRGMNHVDPGLVPKDVDPETLQQFLIREAFRQGWTAARHWPNHALPDPIGSTVETTDSGEYVVLTISWPPQ